MKHPLLMVSLTGLLAIATGTVCIVAAWSRWSATIDEPNHVATGLEWWEHGTFHMWTETPPLVRAAVAFGPWLSGASLGTKARVARMQPFDSYSAGLDILHRGGAYERNLAQARAGVLPFFVLVALLVGALAYSSRCIWAVLVAVALAATWPPLVAHSALATTDVGFCAMFLAVVCAFVWFFRRPASRPWSSVTAGLAVGLAFLAKLLTILFLPITVAVLWFYRSKVRTTNVFKSMIQAVTAMLVACIVIWAGYRFSVGRISDLPGQLLGGPVLSDVRTMASLERWAVTTPIPAPEFFHGLLAARAHAKGGHPSYFFGKESGSGFFLSYITAIALKTPIPGLLALVFGLGMLFFKRHDPRFWLNRALFFSGLGVLLVLSLGRVHLGIRHALVVYLFWTAAAAGGWTIAIETRFRWPLAALCGALLVGQGVVLVKERQRLVSYFNGLAGAQPGRILGDADLDWGQDVLPLANEVRRRGIQTLHVSLFGDGARLCDRFGAQLKALPPGKPVTGWVAISQQHLWASNPMFRLRDPCNGDTTDFSTPVNHPFAWLRDRAPVRGGTDGVLLYHLP